MPSPTLIRVLGNAYVAASALLWPATTIISTAFALKLKVPPLRRRLARAWLRPGAANS